MDAVGASDSSLAVTPEHCNLGGDRGYGSSHFGNSHFVVLVTCSCEERSRRPSDPYWCRKHAARSRLILMEYEPEKLEVGTVR